MLALNSNQCKKGSNSNELHNRWESFIEISLQFGCTLYPFPTFPQQPNKGWKKKPLKFRDSLTHPRDKIENTLLYQNPRGPRVKETERKVKNEDLVKGVVDCIRTSMHERLEWFVAWFGQDCGIFVQPKRDRQRPWSIGEKRWWEDWSKEWLGIPSSIFAVISIPKVLTCFMFCFLIKRNFKQKNQEMCHRTLTRHTSCR